MKESPDIYSMSASGDISRSPNLNFIRPVLIVIGLVVLSVILLTLLWYGAKIVLLVFAGFLMAIFLRSLSDFLTRHTPLSGTLALTAVLLTIVGLIALGAWLLSDRMQLQFLELSDNLPIAFENLRERISQYPLGRRLADQMPSVRQVVFGRQSTNIFGSITGMFSTAFNVVLNVFVIFISALYFAFRPQLYRDGIIKLVPKDHETRAREILSTIEFTLKRFLLGIVVSMTFNGTLTATGLWLLGVPFAIPLGVITALLSFIPNIGPYIAAVPVILIALSQSPTQAIYTFILYVAAQNLDGFVITPLIQQHAVSIPPVLLIASQLLFAVFFGFLGLLLAVPLVAVIFVVVKMVYVEDILGRGIEVKGEREAQEEVSLEDLSKPDDSTNEVRAQSAK